jgi:hypothetical protein
MNSFFKQLGWISFIAGLLLFSKFLFFQPKTPILFQVVGVVFAILGLFIIGKNKWALIVFGILLLTLIVFTFYLFWI